MDDPKASISPLGSASAGAHHDRHVSGTATVHRVGRWTFPVYELVGDGGTLARMGRTGWFKIYFGSGQRIELADGERWILRSIGTGKTACPVVREEAGRKVAIAGIRQGTYGINTKQDAYVFYRADPKRGEWLLRRFEDELAVVTHRPLGIRTTSPVPLGVVFVCFALARYGILGEGAPTLPSFRWG